MNVKSIGLLALTLTLLTNMVYADSQLYFTHNDHLGTPQYLTDANGTVVWKVESQTPFGEVVINEDADGDGNAVEFNQRFPGQYYDEVTGLNYNYFRDYDPSLGRYIQSDPIGLGGGVNTYGYAAQSPLIYIDPDGQNITAVLGNPLFIVTLGAGLCAAVNCGAYIGPVIGAVGGMLATPGGTGRAGEDAANDDPQSCPVSDEQLNDDDCEFRKNVLQARAFRLSLMMSQYPGDPTLNSEIVRLNAEIYLHNTVTCPDHPVNGV